MTDTLISLISILMGIIGANLIVFVRKKHSLGITGNTIAGVFGSIFFIKSLGRLGFNPTSIMQSGNVNVNLFIINLIVSFCGGMLAVIFIKMVKNKMNHFFFVICLYLNS